MRENDIEFVSGLLVKPPHEKAPDFVKARISIKVEDLGKWLRAKYKAGEEWVNVDVKESKGGKWYASVSTFKPNVPKEKEKPKAHFEDLEDDLPW